METTSSPRGPHFQHHPTPNPTAVPVWPASLNTGHHGLPGAPSRTFTGWAYACGTIALLFAPIVFGPLGAFLANKGVKRGEPGADSARTFCWVTMVIGMALGLLVAFATSGA